jgi:hypothetical protein
VAFEQTVSGPRLPELAATVKSASRTICEVEESTYVCSIRTTGLADGESNVSTDVTTRNHPMGTLLVLEFIRLRKSRFMVQNTRNYNGYSSTKRRKNIKLAYRNSVWRYQQLPHLIALTTGRTQHNKQLLAIIWVNHALLQELCHTVGAWIKRGQPQKSNTNSSTVNINLPQRTPRYCTRNTASSRNKTSESTRRPNFVHLH